MPAGDAGKSTLEASRRRNESEKVVDLVGLYGVLRGTSWTGGVWSWCSGGGAT